MKEIARISGYSRATVSAVLGKKPGISDKARTKILEVVKEYHYRPNLMASALVGKASNLIGVVVRDLTNPYFAEMVDAIESALSAEGYNILYFNTREDHDREVEALQNISAYNVDGLILTPIQIGVDLEHIWLFRRGKTPFISIEKIPGIQVDFVDFENEKGGRLAAGHLIDNGHRDICYLAGPETSISCVERYRGFKTCCLERGLALDDAKSYVPCGATSREGFQTGMRVLQQDARPTAIFCFSDLLATGLYKAAHTLGLTIPDDISIIGFDDVELASILGPSLTTVTYSVRSVGTYLAQSMIRRIRGENKREGLLKVFEPQLIERDSVRRIG